MKIRMIGSLLITTLLALHFPAAAEDIDLFVGLEDLETDIPNVLFMVDNTGNWTQPFTNEIAALVSAFNNMSVNTDGSAKFRVGVMFATETGSGDSNVKGGYVRAAIRPMTSDHKTKYSAMLAALDKQADKGNAGASGLSMAEVYRYFAGGTPYAGNNKVKTDYHGNTAAGWSNPATTPASKAAMQTIYALADNALTSKVGTTYHSPIPDGYCGKNFIIYISNGANQEPSAADTDANNMLSAAGGSTAEIPISPTGSQSNPSDEWARFMKSQLDVTTYTLDVDKVTNGQGPGWTALLRSMATISNGKYFDVSSTGGQINVALDIIFSEIQAVNSVFASVSLPVSVNTEGTYLNQVYVGMFRPDQNALPRWSGNLKQYKLGKLSGILRTIDADGANAINSATGFVTECARSYWTPTSVDSYWSFRRQGGCLAVANSDASNYPDGSVVEKGAQAYKLRGTTTRTVKTCSTTFSSCTALTDFNSASVTAAMLGVTATAERDELINWEKGLDVPVPSPSGGVDGDENNNNITLTEMRPSAHGDVVHSRPVAINFGTDASPQVVVFYGGNDGILRAINGNRTATIGGIAAGGELWAFVAPEFYSQINRLRKNNTTISFYGSTADTPPPLPKPYGFDGPVTAYADADETWIYPTMRRGGRVLYAFDVSTPTSPSLKWKKGCPNNFQSSGTVSDSDCTTSYTDIGQTWSAPKVMKTAGYLSGAAQAPMLIMGGGYDTCEDADPNTCSSSSKGKSIYVLDADSGALLKTFATERSVVADIFIIPNSSGEALWAYATDLGGNIYRISGADANTAFGSTAPGNWTMTKIASLGCDTAASCTTNRKFMFAPDIVEDDDGSYVLMLGSGDREKPLRGFDDAYGVSNYFFMLRDQPNVASWLSSESTNCGSNLICKSSLLPITTSADPDASLLAAKKGWYLGLNAHEQVVTSAITVFGVITFSTHTPALPPATGVCSSNLGTARVYNIDYKNAASLNGTGSRYETIVGGGLPPSPVAGMVTLDDGQTVPFVIGGDPESPIQSSDPPAPLPATQPKGMVYWNIQQ